MLAKERDSKVSRVQLKRGAWHRVKRQISSDAEEVEAVAHLEITFESSFMSAESTGMVASTYHRNGYPLELGILVHNSQSRRASKPLGVDAKDCSANQTQTQSLVNSDMGFAPKESSSNRQNRTYRALAPRQSLRWSARCSEIAQTAKSGKLPEARALASSFLVWTLCQRFLEGIR